MIGPFLFNYYYFKLYYAYFINVWYVLCQIYLELCILSLHLCGFVLCIICCSFEKNVEEDKIVLLL